MYLKNLEISGFKSFGKKDSLEFSSPITAIVGPNGSGKSNIAEAFRFVLGEQSIKSMRGKRGEDLIWNGSQTVPRASRASVKVVFDNREKALPIDFEEVILERTVYRDSVNEYFLNGSRVRLKDILELLASAHIGASGHHIISQGEADKILNTNPKERKEIIEDALGLKIYQYKRLESERKLEKTEENIQSVESLRREIAPHLRFLKKQIEKVERARATKEELRFLYREYLKREEIYLATTKKEIEDRRRGPEANLKRLENELAKAKKILEGSHSRDKKTERVFSLELNIKKAREEKDALTRELGRIEGEIASNERVIIRQKALEQEKGEGSVSIRDIETLASEIELKAETQSPDVLTLKEIIKTILHSVRDFISSHRQMAASPIVADSQKEIGTLDGKKKEIEKQIASLKNNEEEFEKEYRALKEEIEKEKDTSRDAEKEVFRIMAQEREVRSTLAMVANDEMTHKRANEDFKRELMEAGVLIGAAILEYKTFVLKDENGKEIGVKSVMEEPRDVHENRRRAVEKLKIRLEEMGGGGEEMLKEYKETSERDEFLARELTDLEKSAADLKTLIEELQEKLSVEFKDGVSRINQQFKDFFALMFGGGSASLSVVEEHKRKRLDTDIALSQDEEISLSEEEEIEEGIEISVSLPRKKIKGLMMLSGGERALTSIALLFAISQVKPPPFIILDETDAALDEANSRKYGDMIENLSKKSQLILITHNRETMSRAGVLYGVTMDSGGMSKLLSVKFDEAVVVAK